MIAAIKDLKHSHVKFHGQYSEKHLMVSLMETVLKYRLLLVTSMVAVILLPLLFQAQL
jgi:hypothetical protein